MYQLENEVGGVTRSDIIYAQVSEGRGIDHDYAQGSSRDGDEHAYGWNKPTLIYRAPQPSLSYYIGVVLNKCLIDRVVHQLFEGRGCLLY